MVWFLQWENHFAIAQTKEPPSHQKSKHILRIYHFIKEIMEHGDIKIEKVEGKDNATLPLTKALGIKEYHKHKREVGKKYMSNRL